MMDVFLKLQNGFMFGTCMCYAVWVVLIHNRDKRKLPKLEQVYGHLCIIRYEPGRNYPWRLFWIVDTEKMTMKCVASASTLIGIKIDRWVHMRRLRAMNSKSLYAELTRDLAENWDDYPTYRLWAYPGEPPKGGSGDSSASVERNIWTGESNG